jgi:hypothetical protein
VLRRKRASPDKNKSWRRRRTAYSSGRREEIGVVRSPVKRKSRTVGGGSKVLDSPEAVSGSVLDRTPLRSNFRWRRG